MFNFTALPPLSLYVHLPWCVRKCPYCDFNSHQAQDDFPEQRYVDALIADLEQDLPQIWGRQVVSIFFGGGTPSLFSASALERLLEAIRARLVLRADAEITLEANPGTVDQERFAGYRAAGINRLSLGIQSFDTAALKRLGRIHDADQARRAIETAHAAGFDNFNVDLMYGLPEQTLSGALTDIQTALSFAPTHLSHYQLTIEPNTRFHHSPPRLPEDDLIWDMHEACLDALGTAGYPRYEVSAYAQPGRRCRHNLNYWRFGDYLGIGAGAHAKITDASSATITRISKRRHPRDYLANAAGASRVDQRKTLSAADATFEFVLNALRLVDGFDAQLFVERTGLSLAQIQTPLREAVQRGWLSWREPNVRPSAEGMRVLNEVLLLFLPEAA
ncbi:MAG: coproporphyrinogen III oxidase [Gammaproteobacteria bacterium SG8_47]|nr:MAG: coproporphyrinogen III oxidase [Gammaproteobacteria bacterium SG8_47]